MNLEGWVGLLFGVLVGVVAFVIGALLDVGDIFPRELREKHKQQKRGKDKP